MANERWHLHRACIVNYWYFDEAYFEFSQGKLLLWANGSGKSVTTSSLLPLLLMGRRILHDWIHLVPLREN
ncbi:hypothetical protein [Enterococcus mundtii]|uniref:hypothetical protein n=1 Tax=Enterococcus mundtii TaxID=53346 RepID=UPI0035C6CE19